MVRFMVRLAALFSTLDCCMRVACSRRAPVCRLLCGQLRMRMAREGEGGIGRGEERADGWRRMSRTFVRRPRDPLSSECDIRDLRREAFILWPLVLGRRKCL